MSLRDLLVRIKDKYVREPRMVKEYYHEKQSEGKPADCYVFMVDGRIAHGGMFDRLKGLITVYAVAKSYGIPFRVHFTYPFRLEKYLEPVAYDWRIDDKDLVYHYPDSRPVIAYGEIYNPRRLLRRRHGQVHFYYGYNSLDAVNARFGKSYDWGSLYRELFRPTAYLQPYIDNFRREIGREYMVVHTRFMNLLGDKVETLNNPLVLGDADKAVLMRKVLARIKKLTGENKGLRLMLASDSMVFIDYALKALPDAYVVPGTVKHIDTAGETDDAENIKLFTDYYLIAGARRVYNLVAGGMWPSAFPEYAAKIGGVPFERINIG